MVNTSFAFILSIYVSTSYVASLFLLSKGGIMYMLQRNDPTVMRCRIKRITLICLANIAIVPCMHWLLSDDPNLTISKCVLNLGIVPGLYVRAGSLHWDVIGYFWDAARAVGLTAILYGCDMVDSILYYFMMPYWDPVADFRDEILNLHGFRNIVVGPATEELVYTSMNLQNYLILANSTPTTTLLLLLPLFFGFAHIPHGMEMYFSRNYTIAEILNRCLFQILYTTVFGAFTNFIYLRTGNLYACILVHALCNYMSFPNLSSQLAADYQQISEKKQSRTWKEVVIRIWSYLYIPCLLFCIVGFKNSLWTLTYSKNEIEQ
ncbi:HDL437Wp [Eremothecium sinecaudum]|uniref:intramembrane prenyl-peptidase Rce1 n=1 Tax=Eremothecium sinecaudum TaxID=45286 RepID=A0A0X8HRV3_9SACH|nr:HDL437Wp [Eremothecium sinecaudum]AMD20307.1 HDL437Wp [Eremothecium sinecaudum]